MDLPTMPVQRSSVTAVAQTVRKQRGHERFVGHGGEATGSSSMRDRGQSRSEIVSLMSQA